MVNERMYGLGSRAERDSRVVRVLRHGAQGGNRRQNVFDFSIGNPSVPAPDAAEAGGARAHGRGA